MPWRERSPMDERVQFISDHRRQLWTMTELCERYSISRKTGYKWLARYDAHVARLLPARVEDPLAAHIVEDEIEDGSYERLSPLP